MRVLTAERRALYQQRTKREKIRFWLKTDKVEILHDNDMYYSFLRKQHMRSNSDIVNRE
jgi:hypothetical protein